jgi:hypothetical protein
MSKYLPRGLSLKDPRSMRREDMVKFFEHIGNRQSSHGIRDAFRFKAVLSSRKKGDLGGVKYMEPQRDLNPALTLGITVPMPTEIPVLPVSENVDNPAIPGVPEITPTTTPVLPVSDRIENTAMAQVSGSAHNTETTFVEMTSVFRVNPVPTPSQLAPSRRKPMEKGVAREKISDKNIPTPASVTEQAKATAQIRPRPTYKKKNPSSFVPESSAIMPDIAQPGDNHPTLTLDPVFDWDPEIVLDRSLDPDLDIQSHMNRNDELLAPWMSIPITSMNADPMASTLETTVPSTSNRNDELLAPWMSIPITSMNADPMASTLETTVPSTSATRPSVLEPAPPDPARTPQAKKIILSKSAFTIPDPARTPRRKADLLAMEEAKKYVTKGKSRR